MTSTYIDRKKEAEEYFDNCKVKQPCKEDKYKTGQRVHIKKELDSGMGHFPSDVDAIIEYTYAQKYGGDDHKRYSVIILVPDGTDYSCAWYNEYDLEPII